MAFRVSGNGATVHWPDDGRAWGTGMAARWAEPSSPAVQQGASSTFVIGWHMLSTKLQSTLFLMLACAIHLATAQSLDAQREYNERQLRERLDRDRESQRNREAQQNWDANWSNIQRHEENNRSSSQGQGAGQGSGLAPALFLAVIGGALIEWSRQPRAQRPAIDYVKETRRHRQGLVFRQCMSTHQASLVVPQYEKPNAWGAIRIFQSNRAEEFKVALVKYQTALAEGNPTCKCVGERSISEAGFSDPEWRKIAEGARAERPWMALEESRARDVFEACAANSPSNTELSWLYAGVKR